MKTDTLQHQLACRFDALRALSDGWLDGKGVAPNKRNLAEVGRQMLGSYPENIPLPIIAPTPEGNLLLEWALPGDPSVDLHLDSMRAAFHAFLPLEKEIGRDFILASHHDWKLFFDFLAATLEQHLA